MHRVALELPDDLHNQLRAKAACHGLALERFILTHSIAVLWSSATLKNKVLPGSKVFATLRTATHFTADLIETWGFRLS